MSAPAFFDGVLTLAQTSGPDRGRVLLRAVTELFVEAPRHTRVEIAVYEELALPLLKVAALEDRRFVAGLLAPQDDTPPAVIRSLLHDDIAVSEMLLAGCPHLGEVDLLALIATGTERHLERMAERPHLPAVVVEALVRNMKPEALTTLLANHSIRIPEDSKPSVLEAAQENPSVARALARRFEDFEDTDLTDLFLVLDSRGRRRVVQALEILALRDFAARRRMPSTPAPEPVAVEDLARAALSRDVSTMAARLADLLGVDRSTCRALLTDAGGEPLAIALKAAGLGAPLATRIILFSGAEDSRNYAEVKRLVELFETVSLRSALMLVDIWRGVTRPVRPRRGYAPVAEAGTPIRSSAGSSAPTRIDTGADGAERAGGRG